MSDVVEIGAIVEGGRYIPSFKLTIPGLDTIVFRADIFFEDTVTCEKFCHELLRAISHKDAKQFYLHSNNMSDGSQ